MVIDDLVVIDSKEQGRAIRFCIHKDENGALDRDVLAMLKEIAISTEVLVVAEGETLVHIEAHDTVDPVSITGLVIEKEKIGFASYPMEMAIAFVCSLINHLKATTKNCLKS